MADRYKGRVNSKNKNHVILQLGLNPPFRRGDPPHYRGSKYVDSIREPILVGSIGRMKN